jgi:hypothetical protein
MKKISLLLIVFTLIVSCKNETNTAAKKEKFPSDLAKVFEKHGGLNVWNKMRILSFNNGEEIHTSDLHTRKIIINTPTYSLGFNGEETWLTQEDSTSFKGNKDFYYNLFFYFYAMPFVLADPGITYEKSADLLFEGIQYPGYKISYASEKGTSPDDNYIIYYNPETYQMAWLAYTVTFKSKAPSEKYNLIRYLQWETTNGFVLPREITWYKKDENGLPTVPASPATVFTLPLLSEATLGDAFFEKSVE